MRPTLEDTLRLLLQKWNDRYDKIKKRNDIRPRVEINRQLDTLEVCINELKYELHSYTQ